MCVPEGCVEWDMQVSVAGDVGIIRNDMDDRRRVVWLGLWEWALFTNKSAALFRTLRG